MRAKIKFNKVFFIILFCLILIASIPIGILWYNKYSNNNYWPKLNKLPQNNSLVPTVKQEKSGTTTLSTSKIKDAIETVINNYPQLSFGISFIDLNTGSRVDVNGNQIFTAASTTKVLIACLLLSQVEAGKYSLSQSLDGSTIQVQLQQMINQSSNDSWESLMNFMGFQYQKPYAEKIGVTTYDVANNRISPNDMSSILAQLYQGKLLNPNNTKLLLSYMQHTNNDELIPPEIPQGVAFYHKYGSFEGNLHDTAIVDNGINPFVLTIFTSTRSGFLTYSQRIMAFHQIVKAVEDSDNITSNNSPSLPANQ